MATSLLISEKCIQRPKAPGSAPATTGAWPTLRLPRAEVGDYDSARRLLSH